MTYTTPQNVLDRWLGDDSPEGEEEKLQILIEDVEDEIIRNVPSVPERIGSGELPLIRVLRVVSSVIMRAWKTEGNPLSSWSETSGPFSQSGSMSQSVSRNLKLTADEIQSLSPAPTPGVYMLDTAVPQYGRFAGGEVLPTLRRVDGGGGYDFYTNIPARR